MFTAASHREHEAYNDNTSQQTSDGPIHLTMSTDTHTHTHITITITLL